MCGICGMVTVAKSEAINHDLLNRMSSALSHRGPDDQGVYISEIASGQNQTLKVGLGHRRLSIIDLSNAGHQPMCNEDKSVWITFNGEIYNFIDLRRDLKRRGHNFSSDTDTETIIHLYEELGVDCLKQLRGMFAFALWDANKQRLILARDRIGQKPLSYAVNGQALVFASEIKAILQVPEISQKINIKALDSFLTYKYIPAPETMFENIKKLPPAHILIWEKGSLRIEQYWNLSFRNKVYFDNTQEYCERIMGLCTEATKIRMISDVPLGAFLSGGVDSSAVVAIMSKLSSSPVKTFSIGFEEKSFNELAYAKEVAKIFSTDHHEYTVKPNALEVLPKLIWHFDEPFADVSAIATYYLSKMTRSEVTVALNGDGGDESFAGYDRYLANYAAGAYNKLPLCIRNSLFSLLAKFPEGAEKKNFVKNLKRFTRVDVSSREERYASWMATFDDSIKNELYSHRLKNEIGDLSSFKYILDAYQEAEAQNFLDATLSVDMNTYLPGDLLVKIDIASMANSLEARSPFLDHKLLEFLASVPPELKIQRMTTKYIFKKAFKGVLPEKILRRRKEGFAVPINAWFRNELKDFAYETLLDQSSLKRGYFNKAAVKKLLDQHSCGAVDHEERIWNLINLELWHRMFIDHKDILLP